MKHTDFIPTQSNAARLRERLGSEAFIHRVEQALKKLNIVEAVDILRSQGYSENRAVQEAGSGMSRSWYRNQRRRLDNEQGENWERLLDRRAPEKTWQIPSEWRVAVTTIRMIEATASFDRIRSILVKQFGNQACIGDSSIRRILHAVDMLGNKGEEPQKEEMIILNGGGGMTLLLAAATESGAVKALAEVIKAAAANLPNKPMPVSAEPEGRDARGCLTAEYNRNRLKIVPQGAPDPRYRSIDETRKEKDLSRLSIRGMKQNTIEDRLMTAIVTPLLTDRRGFIGLDGPFGTYSKVVSPLPYMAATLDKFMRELKYAGLDKALWDSYLIHWFVWDQRWTRDQGLRRYVAYLDGTQDPWWTKQFARSGKVSRIGRVMPCVSRLLISGGAGTPLLIETYSGQASIKAELLGLIDRVDNLLGEGQLGRLLVVDAELISVPLFETLIRAGRHFITVLKGPVLRNLSFEPCSEATSFRDRDKLREGKVRLCHPDKDQEPLTLRTIEMVRPDSRQPTPTYFGTSVPSEVMSATEVAQAYLARWPLNENIFRSGRGGIGLQRTHGFGRQYIQNIALITEKEKVRSRCLRLEESQIKATERVDKLEEETALSESKLSELKKKRKQAVYVNAARRKVETQSRHVRAIKAELNQARDKLKDITTRRNKALKEATRLKTMPPSIAVRDVTLDSIATCLKMTLLSLMLFVFNEYFGDLRMEPRTFIEEFVRLPVRIIDTPTTIRYLITGNHRSPKRMKKFCMACEEVNRRKIYYRGRLLLLEVILPMKSC
jgi:hypothetical protein